MLIESVKSGLFLCCCFIKYTCRHGRRDTNVTSSTVRGLGVTQGQHSKGITVRHIALSDRTFKRYISGVAARPQRDYHTVVCLCLLSAFADVANTEESLKQGQEVGGKSERESEEINGMRGRGTWNRRNRERGLAGGAGSN